MKNNYAYNGPVFSFGKLICNNFSSKTVAVSESKAYSNFCHQYKVNNNLSLSFKIELDRNKIERIIEERTITTEINTKEKTSLDILTENMSDEELEEFYLNKWDSER